MASRSAPSIDPTDAEMRELINLVRVSKALLEKHRFVLAEDKRKPGSMR